MRLCFLEMGSCVSVHKRPDSSVKIGLSLTSKTKKLLIPSPNNHKTMNAIQEPINSGVFPDFRLKPSPANQNRGSKEENFFDTQAWLDSDCEDDFLSVNGDFVTSQCSTPRYQSSAPVTPRLGKTSCLVDSFSNIKTETSPPPSNKKKKLGDLFKESIGGDEASTKISSPLHSSVIVRQNLVNEKLKINKTSLPAVLPLKSSSSNGGPYVSGQNSICSSVRTPNKDEGGKAAKAAQCCLPNLVQSLSFTERKKPLSPSPLLVGG